MVDGHGPEAWVVHHGKTILLFLLAVIADRVVGGLWEATMTVASGAGLAFWDWAKLILGVVWVGTVILLLVLVVRHGRRNNVVGGHAKPITPAADFTATAAGTPWTHAQAMEVLTLLKETKPGGPSFPNVAKAAAKVMEPATLTPRTDREQAQIVRRINAARPVMKRLNELFYKHGDAQSGWRGGFDSMFLDTCLAIPKKDPWDHWAWALHKLNQKMILNDAIETMIFSLEGYEHDSTKENFRELATAIAAVYVGAYEWVETLFIALNEEPELLAARREVFRKWIPGFNDMVDKLAAFAEEARGIDVGLFDGEPFVLVVDKEDQFHFTSRSSARLESDG